MSFFGKQLDTQAYNQHFYQNSQEIRAGPVPNERRSCNDICCLITFILIILAALIIGAIMINDGRQLYTTTFDKKTNTVDMAGLSSVFSTQGGIIVGMFFFSLVLAILYIFLIKTFARCMVYTMIILIFLCYAALIVFGAINGLWWMVIVFGIAVILTALMLWCFWGRIQTGILLLQVTSAFLSEKPTVYLSPLYPLIFGIMFFVYWVVAMIAELYYLYQLQEEKQTDPNVSTSKPVGFIVVWVILFIFMAEFLYYVQTFLVGTCCAFWYYGIQANYCTSGSWTMNRYHLGSITFGALLITILGILKRLAREQGSQQSAQGNPVVACCLCITACCLACIENIIKTLNHNAIIVMTVTGQSYINSAKTALSIIFQNFGLFAIVDFISDLVTFFGILITIGIPTLTGFLIIRYGRLANQNISSYAAIAIFFLSMLISGVIVTMIGEALSCVFIFFCFDQKFRNMGITIPNSPPAIKQFLQYGNTGQEMYMIRGPPASEQNLKGRYM